jgi:hypothetical protein
MEPNQYHVLPDCPANFACVTQGVHVLQACEGWHALRLSAALFYHDYQA